MTDPAARLSPGGRVPCPHCGTLAAPTTFCVNCGGSLVSDGRNISVPERRLPWLQRVGVQRQVHFVGVHGGAGESTLAELAGSAGVAAGHGWPVFEPDGLTAAPAPAVLVARSHVPGLEALRDAMREEQTRSVPVEVVGVAIVSDTMAPMPKELKAIDRTIATLAAATYGRDRLFLLPYLEQLRLGKPITAIKTPRAYGELFAFVTNFAN